VRKNTVYFRVSLHHASSGRKLHENRQLRNRRAPGTLDKAVELAAECVGGRIMSSAASSSLQARVASGEPDLNSWKKRGGRKISHGGCRSCKARHIRCDEKKPAW